MRKKLLVFFFVLVSLVACGVGFTACNLFGDNDDGGEHTHTIVHVNAKAASCAEEGNKEHWYCNSCGDYFSDGNGENKTTLVSLKINKLPHTEVTDAAVPKTCTTDGKTEGKHCSVCKEVIVAQTVVKAGHLEVIDKGKEPTCTTDGLTDGRRCNSCGKVTLAQTVIPASHTLETDKGKAATCTATGLTDGEHCTKCNYVKAGEVIPANGHTEVIDEAVTPSCTVDGKTEGKHCSVCKTVTVQQLNIPAAHKPETDAAVAATCTSTGKTEGKHCSVCKTVLVAQQIVPITHSGNGPLCDKCEALTVPESVGLDLTPITANTSSASGYAGTLNIIGYEVKGRGTCTDANVVIPATYNGLPVLGLGLQAFLSDTIITSVVIPNGVRYIGIEAFMQCSNLKTATIASSVDTMESGCFYHCISLSSINIPPKVKTLTQTFGRSDSLTTLTIPVTVTTIESSLDISHLTDIYYTGTQAQWNAIDIGRWSGMWNSYQAVGQVLTVHCTDGNITITGLTLGS